MYRSYYSFDEQILEHFKSSYKTITGYVGKLYLEEIIIDIDKKEGTDDQVLYRTQCFLEQLEEDWKIDRTEAKIWYSGSGYHIAFPDIFRFEPSNYLHEEVKATLTKYFPEMDPMPLMKTGLIRVGYSYNKKTGRYKIPLSATELYSLTSEEIIKLSETFAIRSIERDIIESVPDFSSKKIVKEEKKKKEEKKNEPTRIVTCAQQMFAEGAKEGSRHQILVRMIASWRMAGLTLPAAMILAKEWNKKDPMNEYELEKHVNYIWDKGYTPGCDDSVRLKYCSQNCIYYEHKNYVLEVTDASSAEEKYRKFMNTDFSKTSFDLSEIFPMDKRYRFLPGEHVIITGGTGLGKTAFMQNICVKLNRMRILYLSLEVGVNLLFRRSIQIKYGMTREEVENHYLKGGESLAQGVDHIYIMTLPPDIEGIKRLVAQYSPHILVVDTIDGIKSLGKDAVFNSERVGIELKNIAQKHDIIVISVQHITKAASVNDKGQPKELTVHSGKGSSAIEQKADRVIGIEGSQESPVRLIRSLKTRDDEAFAMQIQYHANTTFQMEKLTT